jgi:hypothetical protein
MIGAVMANTTANVLNAAEDANAEARTVGGTWVVVVMIRPRARY